jgi:ABC-type multidrug transport system fused ATPase/permease subunit
LGKINSIQNDRAIVSAISSSGLAPVIEQLPNALDTKLCNPVDDELFRITQSLGLEQTPEYNSFGKDNFTTFSGGQSQRLALAQMFMRISEAALLVLDPPSSNLDPQGEYEFQNIKNLRQDKSTIFISHHLAKVRMADKTCVMENGG